MDGVHPLGTAEMNKKDLKPGDRVLASMSDYEWGDNELIPYCVDEYGDYTLTGTILDRKSTQRGFVVVKWDESDFDREEEEEVDPNLLVLESDRDALNAEFKTAQKAIEEKMKEAAALVEEAGRMANDAHARSLQSLYKACRPLVSAMDNNGWRSSSWGC